MSVQQSEGNVMHPTLPGGDLGCERLAGELVCLYDPRNPDAYIVGEVIEVGVQREDSPK